ncbi:uncharacterized protein METZ01_LOCUS66193 [marine metagenome]|uniref:Uncharacterized protein n=1 Tax=marine metagenome TaxID=408172 RepID=A0A381TC81_9ZZZZ
MVEKVDYSLPIELSFSQDLILGLQLSSIL